MEKQFPDFFRLAKGLRAMKFDFTKVRDYSEEGNSEAIIADDVNLKEANLLTSRHRFGRARSEGKGMHRIVLDIDYDAALIPSSRPGHYHLILDRALEWKDYKELLELLGKQKIIEPGYANASINKGFTAIRAPWEKKK